MSDEISSTDDVRPYLDLVVISHFDRDHISGIIRLLERFDVGDLLLPYVPLWKRLAIAFQLNERPRSSLTRFLLDPIEFISRLSGSSVKRILYTLSAEPPLDGAVSEARGPVSPDGARVTETTRPSPHDQTEEGEGTNLNIRIQKHVFSDSDITQEKLVDSEDLNRHSVSGIEVEYLAVGSALVVANRWEFVPYNDAKLASLATAAFRKEVERLRNDLLLTSERRVREQAFQDLKNYYDITLGRSNESRNVISLFMYAGPMSSSLDRCRSRSYVEISTEGGRYLRNCLGIEDRWGGVLYTGDGYIDNDRRLLSLQSYLTSNRFSRIYILQVMHHGAEDNWYKNLAKKIKPSFSVFSSDPGHGGYKHPHAAVLRDFWPYGPLQVNKQTTVTFEFEYKFVTGR
ncbi:hypothetical protein F0169_26650 [Pseudomonas sp. MAFF 212408]|uniref:MBL fold metallo-hydrolase n=1 Tax=Pseudomonas kitaguniensis TaxID=2607908 RepID=A0A5N7KT28_9PSED|nr:hypothetical protein [Pseudomonas kitaguniensis]MPR05338.1 hypothetical protein [Pseudomonas kitaguniensis]